MQRLKTQSRLFRNYDLKEEASTAMAEHLHGETPSRQQVRSNPAAPSSRCLNSSQ